MTEKKPYEGKADLFAEGTELRNLAERNGVEVVDFLVKIQTSLHHLLEQKDR